MTSKKVSFQEIENTDEEQGITQFEIDNSPVKKNLNYVMYW